MASTEQDRGREARTPSEIPARGWKDIILRVYKNIGKDRVIALAAGVTFYSILALFPAIAALVSIYGLFADPTTIAKSMNALSLALPEGALIVVGDQINRIAAQGSGQLTLTFMGGLLVALWSANAGIKSMLDALNLVYSEEEKRGFIKLNAVSLTFTVATIGFVLVALGAMVVLPLLMQAFGFAAITERLIVARQPSARLTDLQPFWQRVRARASLKDVRIHDLRHTFASTAAVASGQGLPMIGKLLGHTQVQTTARYAHLVADPVKTAADQASGNIAASLNQAA